MKKKNKTLLNLIENNTGIIIYVYIGITVSLIVMKILIYWNPKRDYYFQIKQIINNIDLRTVFGFLTPIGILVGFDRFRKSQHQSNKILLTNTTKDLFNKAVDILYKDNEGALIDGGNLLVKIFDVDSEHKFNIIERYLNISIRAFINTYNRIMPKIKEKELTSLNGFMYFNNHTLTIFNKVLRDLIKVSKFKNSENETISLDLSNFIFQKINFSDLYLSNVNFKNSKFLDCIFENTTLINADFRWTALRNCTFKHANVKGCNFSQFSFAGKFTDIDFTTIKDKVLHGDFFDNKTAIRRPDSDRFKIITEFKNCNLEGISFKKYLVRRDNLAKFDSCNLKRANLALIDLEVSIINAAYKIEFTNNCNIENAIIDYKFYSKLKKQSIKGLNEVDWYVVLALYYCKKDDLDDLKKRFDKIKWRVKGNNFHKIRITVKVDKDGNIKNKKDEKNIDFLNENLEIYCYRT